MTNHLNIICDENHSAFEDSTRCPSDSRKVFEVCGLGTNGNGMNNKKMKDGRCQVRDSGQTRSSKKWDWPATPTEKSSTWYPQENRDWQSPTGHGVEAASKEGLPNEFKQSREFLDSREVFGKTLLRRVASTAWSAKYSLAGREVQSIKLVDMIWKGYRNHHLRSLSHGHYMSLVVARKINEAVFASAILSAIRERKWDLDDIAKNFLQSHPELCPSKGRSSQEEAKAQQVTILAKEVISTLPLAPPWMTKTRGFKNLKSNCKPQKTPTIPAQWNLR